MRRTPLYECDLARAAGIRVSSAQCLCAKVRRESGVAEAIWDEWPEKGIKRPDGGTRVQTDRKKKGREVASAGATVRDASRPSSAQFLLAPLDYRNSP
jgi:hypothetical protein